MRQLTPETMPELVDYNQPIEESKDLMFGVDAGIITTRGGIPETSSRILWTTPDEPVLMLLIPPIHLAVLHAGYHLQHFLGSRQYRAVEFRYADQRVAYFLTFQNGGY